MSQQLVKEDPSAASPLSVHQRGLLSARESAGLCSRGQCWAGGARHSRHPYPRPWPWPSLFLDPEQLSGVCVTGGWRSPSRRLYRAARQPALWSAA